jgi:hypothetical protein
MLLLVLTLVMNTVVMFMSIAAAIRIPSWGYKLTGGVAVVAVAFAFHQVQTGRSNWLALLFTCLLYSLMLYRLMSFRRRLPKK